MNSADFLRATMREIAGEKAQQKGAPAVAAAPSLSSLPSAIASAIASATRAAPPRRPHNYEWRVAERDSAGNTRRAALIPVDAKGNPLPAEPETPPPSSPPGFDTAILDGLMQMVGASTKTQALQTEVLQAITQALAAIAARPAAMPVSSGMDPDFWRRFEATQTATLDRLSAIATAIVNNRVAPDDGLPDEAAGWTPLEEVGTVVPAPKVKPVKKDGNDHPTVFSVEEPGAEPYLVYVAYDPMGKPQSAESPYGKVQVGPRNPDGRFHELRIVPKQASKK